jgi:hypothetical protein
MPLSNHNQVFTRINKNKICKNEHCSLILQQV